MMSRQRRRLLLIVSVSLLLVMFTSVQFQAQNLLPPPPAPGENTVIVPLLPQSDPMQFTGVRDTELLQNGGFEVAGANAKQAANWTGVNLLSTSRRLCDRIGHPTKPDRIVAHEGSCGFRFNAQITNVTRQIKQIVPVIGTVNDTLEMSYWATGNNISTPPRAQVVVTYTDKTKQKLKIPALTGTFGYTQFSGSMSLEKTPKKIVVKFIVAGSGRLYIDEASLRHEFYQYAPVANDDALVAVIGTAAVAGNVTGNDMLANPPAAVASFGGGSLGGAVGDNMAGATVAIPGSGGVTVSVAADGTVNVDAASGTPIPGTYTFDYLLQNVAGSDAATVTLNVNSAPVANPDTFKMLANTVLSGNLNSDNGGGADVMGVPTATITSFGGGSLGGDVTSNAAGSAVSLAGGTLTVNPNGAITLSNPLQGGLFTFSYRLSNTAGFSDGLVTIEINKAPTAVDDGPYNVNVNTSLNVTTAGNDLLDNDDRGYPLASIVSFGLSTATESAPGASVSVAGGTLVVNADGSFSLTTPTITGTYTFHYAIENIIGSDTATVTFNVRRPPLAEDDAFNMLVNGTLNGDLKANNGSGIDIPGTPPFNALYFGGGDVGGSVTSHLAPASVPLAGGTLTINADGTFSLVNPTQTGVFTFTYRLTNAIPAFDTATVTIEIRSAPVAVDDGPYLIGTGQTLTVTTAAANDLLDNDTRGYPLASVISFGGGNATLGGVTDLPAGGTANNFGGGNLTVNANGSFTLVNPTMPGTYTFLYRISNIVGSSDAIVTIQVQQSPVAQNDAFNMLLNGTLGGDLTANNGSGVDSLGTPPFNSLQFGGGDLGGGVTSYLAPATVPLAGGALTVNADGTFTLLNPLQTGVFSFTYRITNAIPASDDAVVTIEVRKAPSAVDDGIYLVGTGQTLTVTTASNHLLDNDDRGYPLAQVSTFGGGSVGGTISTNLSGASVGLAGGTLTVNANGSFTLATPNVPGTYTFLYRIANAAGMSDATVTIQVQQSPVAQDDSFIVQLNGTLNGNLTADNGSGVDSPGVPPYNSLTFGGGSLTGDASSNAAGATVELAGGDLTVNLDGTFSLVNPTQAGVYTFQYRLSNTIPASDDATVTIDVRATPVVQDDALIATYGVTNNFPAGTLFADNGSGADFLGVPAGSIDSFGTVSATQMLTEEPQFVSFAGGTLRVNADGSIIVANPTQTGEFIFYYRLQNASGFDDAQVTVTVQRPPTANDDAFTVQINTTLNGDLNDDNGSGADILGYPVATVASFGGGSLTGDASSNAAGATVELAGGDLTVNSDGTISLVNPTLTGVYTFQYRLSNTIPASDDATVTIDVRAAPIAQDDAWIAAYGMVNSEGSLFADNGNGADFLGVPAATVVSFGTTSSTDNVSGTSVPFAGGTLHVQSNGAFTVIEPIQTGEFTFYYRLENVSGFDDAQVTVTVRQAPVARDDAFTMMINTTLSGQNLLSDNGSGADVLGYPVAGISSFGGGSIGTPITTSQPGWTVEFAGGNLTIHANGSFTLLNPTQTGVYTVQYRLTNAVGFSDATVTIDVRAAPIAQDDVGIAGYEMVSSASAGTLFADNGNGADFLGVPAATIVSFGTTSATDAVFGSPVPFAGGTLFVGQNGEYTIVTPTQTGDFTFYYRLQNVSGFDDAQVTITVQRTPTANDDAFTFLYTSDQTAPNSLFSANGGSADQLGYPDAALTHFGGGSLGGSVMDNVAGSSVALADGLLTVNANGSWTLTGQPFTPGTYTFEYRLANTASIANTSTATVTLNIQQQPVAIDDLTYTVVSGQTLNLLEGNGLLVNDALGFPQAAVTSYGGGDAGGTVVTYMANTSVSPVPGYVNGSLQINAAGTGVFTPPTLPTRFCGEFDFSYRLGNSAGSDDAAVKITVLCVPDAKDDLFNSGFVTEAGGVGLTANLFANNGGGADDLGYEAATVTGFSAVGGGATSNTPGTSIAFANGTLTVNADGSFTVASVTTPGLYTFDYTITNTSGNDTATVTIMIDEAPRVLTITPADGAINVHPSTNIVINFSEVVNIASGGIKVECPAETGITFTPTLPLSSVSSVGVNPTSDLPGNTLCVVTVVSSLVTDLDTIDAPNNLDGDSDGIEGPDFVSSFTTAPVAVDDAYTVTPHLTYDSSAVTPQAFSVRNNDDPADSTAIIGFGATAATTTVVPDGTNFITAEGAGGRVVLNADGTFLFYPDAGDTAASGPATFYYTITGGSTAQVTLTFEVEELVWFVDNSSASPVCTGSNVGTQACPVSAPGNGVSTAHTASDTIFIAEGSYDCLLVLKNNVKVIGDGATGTTLEQFSGVSPVSGSSFAPYDTFTGVDPTLTSTASCFTLGTGNTIRGLTVGNTTGYALLSTTAVGTLTVTDVSINGSGGLFSLTDGGTLNGTFNELLSSAHTNPVIDLTNVGGTITHTSGTISHANADNPTLRINGGNPTFTYSGSITKTAGGRVIDIRNTTANTITFSGTVTQNVVAGSGILIDGQTGGTVTFTTINLGSAGTRLNNGAITVTNGSSSSTVNLGTINLYTSGGTGHALTSTGHDGALNITGGNINADNGGRAIDIDGPTGKTALNISLSNVSASGAGDFGVKLVDIDGTVGITTLLSVANKTDGLLVGGSSAAITIKKLNVSNTTADAVRLYNNGGSFTIIGDGTLANVDGEGGSFTNIGENAFDFLNVQNITLNDITVTGTGSHAFTGVGVNTLTIDNVDVSNVGTGDNQHVFNFKDGGTTNLVGTVSITDSLFTNFAENGMYIENFSGTLNLTVTNVEFENNISKLVCSGGNCDGMGILLRADGTATMTVTISSVTFDRIDGIAVSANPEGYSGAFMDIDILNNSFAANTYVSPGNTNNGETAISLRNAQGNGTLKFNVDNNTINNYSGEFALGVIEVEAGDFTNTSGFINNNRINGAPMGEAIMLFADGSNTSDPGSTTSFDLVVAVTNNTVNAPVRGANLAVIGNGSITGSDANTQVTVINNQFNAPVTGPVLRGNLTVETMDFNKVCANITGNNVANGALGTKSIDFYYDDNATAFLQGMAGFGNPNAITRLMPPNNTLTDGVYLDGDGSITSATCTMPVP